MEDREEICREIGQRLIRLRKGLGLSVREMAEHLGIHIETYRNYERGVACVPLKVMRKLRKDFSANLHYLIEGEDPVFTRSFSPRGYFIGHRIQEVKRILSLSTSDLLMHLPLTEEELIALESNQKEADPQTIEVFCESFSLNPEWFIGKEQKPFKVKLTYLLEIEKTHEHPYEPYTLISPECRGDDQPLYFALYLKGEKTYQGLLLYDMTDYALWRLWLKPNIEPVLSFLYQKGLSSVCILNRHTYLELISGNLHPMKAIERGTFPTFSFFLTLFHPKMQAQDPESRKGLQDYGLLRFVKTLKDKVIP